MKKTRAYKKIILLTIVVVAIASVVGVSYAAWSNQLNADGVFELKAAEVTHLTFGGDSDIAIAGLIEPGATLSAKATVKTSNATLSVNFKISKLEVKLAGSDKFEQVTGADSALFALTVVGSTNNSIDIGNSASELTFNFAMRAENVDTEKYPNATFRLTVVAVGALPR